jgi:hypothetical protein
VGVGRDRGADRGHVRHAHRELAPPAPHEPERAEQQRHRGQRDERPRPGERHQTILPNQRSISNPPASSRAIPANAKTAVISVFLSTEVTRRSIEWVMVSASAACAAGSYLHPWRRPDHQGLLVERWPPEAVDGDHRAIGASHADGRHVHTEVVGQLGHGLRIGSSRVLAVGHQQDRRRGEVPDRRR